MRVAARMWRVEKCEFALCLLLSLATLICAHAFKPVRLQRGALMGVRGGGVEVRNGRTSDGKRRLLTLKELLGEGGGNVGGADGGNANEGRRGSGRGDVSLGAGGPGGDDLSTSTPSSIVEDSEEAGAGRRPGAGGMFSRDGVLKLVGYASVAYIGKQYFNGGRYDESPDMRDKVVVITGANTGMGKETAIRLAQLGARVVIGCRSAEKGAAAAKEITGAAQSKAGRRGSGVTAVESLVVDLADLRSIDKFAQDLRQRTDRIDVLVNNAGVMAVPRLEKTKDGFETHVGVNHLGHFHLTNRVWDLVKASPAARVITVSSEAHRFGKVDLEDLNYGARPYERWSAYGQSKLANVLFTRELQKRLMLKGLDDRIIAVCCHPGIVRTELARYLIEDIPKPVLIPLAGIGWFFTKSPRQGAQTQIYLSANPRLRDDVSIENGGPGGQYFSDCHVKKTSKEAEDEVSMAGLWKLSEKLTGAAFEV